MSLLTEVEQMLSEIAPEYMDVLIELYGIEVDLYRKPTNGTEEKVYGAYSGDHQPELVDRISIVPMAGPRVYTFDFSISSQLEPTAVLTKEELLPEDIIQIVRSDEKVARYKVGELSTQGFTVDIYKKYDVAPIGE